MTDARTPSAEAAPAPRAARILAASPILLVADVVRAAAYYADALGFRAPRIHLLAFGHDISGASA